MTTDTITGPTPVYPEPSEVPLIKAAKRKRLTATRTKQLLRAASRAHNDPPPPGDCCGSSCDPCVRDLWKEELACWKERWGDAALENGEKEQKSAPSTTQHQEKEVKLEDQGKEDNKIERRRERMPGSFDW